MKKTKGNVYLTFIYFMVGLGTDIIDNWIIDELYFGGNESINFHTNTFLVSSYLILLAHRIFKASESKHF